MTATPIKRPPRPHPTPAQSLARHAEIQRRLRAGQTHAAIAAALGCNRYSVTYYAGPRCKPGGH